MIVRVAIAISLISISFQASAQQKNPFSKQYKNCADALTHAIDDVETDSIKYFGNIQYQLPADTKKLDSILFVEYNIRSVRTGNLSWDHSEGCYNKCIRQHMDSTLDHNFYFRSWNIMQKLIGSSDTIPRSEVYRNRLEEPEEK